MTQRLHPRPASLDTLTRYCDRLLQTADIQDWDGAVNGLQVGNRGEVLKIAAAVDACAWTIQEALRQKATLLIVHHGLFWGPSHPWTGKRLDLMRTLIEGDLAIYSSHLPLDLHASLGNNIQLCKALGLRNPKPFFPEKGRLIGLKVEARVSREELQQRLSQVLGGAPTLLAGGDPLCRRIGIVTGGAGAELRKAAAEGVDTFITGEGPHWTFPLAEELGVNVFYGGHYLTETFGVRALAAHLSAKFKLPWTFVDHPSGL